MDLKDTQTPDYSWVGSEFRNQLLTIKVPLHWRISYEEDIVSIADPKDFAALVISHWRPTGPDIDLLATDHLDNFLEENQITGFRMIDRTPAYACAHYQGLEHSDWHVAFSRSNTEIFLITLNVRPGLSKEEQDAGLAAFASMSLIHADKTKTPAG